MQRDMTWDFIQRSARIRQTHVYDCALNPNHNFPDYFILFNFFSVRQTTSILSPAGMDSRVLEEEDDCPELVPIDNPSAPATDQIPVTIITGYLGEGSALIIQF